MDRLSFKYIIMSLKKEFVFFFRVFKNPFLFAVGVLLLPFVWFVVNIQIFFIIFWFIIYCILFSMKYLFFKFKVDNIEPIVYKDFFNYDKNIIFFFLIEILLNIPKKYSFIIFYNLTNLILKKYNIFSKKKLNFSFKKIIIWIKKNFVLIIYIFLKLILSIIIIMITSYSLFIMKINNKVAYNFYDLLKFKREGFKSLYSNFILGILTTHNIHLYSGVDGKKIKFDNKFIYTNPLKSIKDIGNIKSACNYFLENTKIVAFRGNTSSIMTGVNISGSNSLLSCVQINKKNIVCNTNYKVQDYNKFIKNNQPPLPIINDDFINTGSKANSNIFIKANLNLDLEHKKNYHTISGYDSKYFKYISGEKASKEPNDGEYDPNIKSDGGNLFKVPIFEIKEDDFILSDASKNVINYKFGLQQKFDSFKQFLWNYNEPYYKYNFDYRDNIISLEKQNQTVKQFFENNYMLLEPKLRPFADYLNYFYIDNPYIFDPLNKIELYLLLQYESDFFSEKGRLFFTKIENKLVDSDIKSEINDLTLEFLDIFNLN